MGTAGAAAGAVVLIYNLSEAGYARSRRYLLAAAFVASILIGACASNAANWVIWDLWDLPLGARIARAGYTGYPGLIFAAGAFAGLAAVTKSDVGKAVNAFAPALCLFHAFARMGCAWAGCCYGVVWPLQLGGVSLTRVPTAAIEAGFCLLLFAVLQSAVRKNRLAIYSAAYAAFRFLIEFVRGDDRGQLIRGLPGSPAQQMAVVMLIASAVWLAARHMQEKNTTLHNEQMSEEAIP